MFKESERNLMQKIGHKVIKGIENRPMKIPLIHVSLILNSHLYTAKVGLVDTLPFPGVHFLLGNDLCKDDGVSFFHLNSSCDAPLASPNPLNLNNNLGSGEGHSDVLHSHLFDHSSDFVHKHDNIHNPTYVNDGESVNVCHDELFPFCDTSDSVCQNDDNCENLVKLPSKESNSLLHIAKDSSNASLLPLEEDIGLKRLFSHGTIGCDTSSNVAIPVTTRAMAKKQKSKCESTSDNIFPEINVNLPDVNLIEEQKADPSLAYCFKCLVDKNQISSHKKCFFLRNDVLMRKYMPPYAKLEDSHLQYYQIVLPSSFRLQILKLAHDSTHFGIRRTISYLSKSFYWPNFQKEVTNYVKACHSCQLGKKCVVPKFALQPIETNQEPFTRLIIDCVGPLPRTKAGNQYILTIMCSTTRFVEGFPLRNIRTTTILKCLMKYFTLFGVPEIISSDQGTNFSAKVFQETMKSLGIKHDFSTPYHPETQGALERFHRTLKNLLRSFCISNTKDWDENLSQVLFSTRLMKNNSTGFSPFDLVFGHKVRGPLELIKYRFLKPEKFPNTLRYVLDFQTRLHDLLSSAKVNVLKAQADMKLSHDKKTKVRSFNVGDKVLVYFPTQFHPFQAKLCGPYSILKKVTPRNYLVATHDRKKKKQLLHINLLKPYFERPLEYSSNENQHNVSNISCNVVDQSFSDVNLRNIPSIFPSPVRPEVYTKLEEYIEKMDDHLKHIDRPQREVIMQIFTEHVSVCSDQISTSYLPPYEIILTSQKPVQQPPYRMPPHKKEILRQKIDELLHQGVIAESYSNYSSSVFLIPKPDGDWRMVVDYRRLNEVCQIEKFPLPRIDDIIDTVASAKYISTLDLKQGYHQIALKESSCHLTAFITPFGLYQFNRIPFGLAGAPAAFQRRMQLMFRGMEEYVLIYIDDIVVFSTSWVDHLKHLKSVLAQLQKWNVVLNIAKINLAKDTVKFLGFNIGNNRVSTLEAKLQPILDYPPCKTRRELMSFLGMASYYRKFCPNFSNIAYPLTNLLKKNIPFIWSDDCQRAFLSLKAILGSPPVLIAPNYHKKFYVMCDASGVGIGGVLAQKCEDVLHPIAFYSKKLNPAQEKYSTIERECLGLVLTLQHFDCYVSSTRVEVLIDHNPLVFLKRMKNSNPRLMRWFLLLQRYNLDITHISGKQNILADALSRAISL